MGKIEIINVKNPIEKYFDKIGRYQYYFFFLLFLSKVPVFWHVLNLLFLAPPIEFHCITSQTKDRETKTKEKNQNTSGLCPCDEPVWDRSVFTEVIQTKYNLLCDETWKISFSESMVFVGALFGSIIFGFLSDRFGRLKIFTLCCLTLAVFGCLVSVMPDVGTFICMRFFEGFGVGGAIVTSFVLLVEYCSTRHRETITALYHIPINIGHMTLAGVSYLLRDWRDLQLAISIPMFFFVIMKWITFESPKWLMDNDNLEEAAMVMDKVLQCNGVENGSIKNELEAYQTTLATTTRRKIQFWQIFRHKKLTINFGCMAFVFFDCGMGYYGMSQYIGKMNGNIHINVAISGALLLPGTIAAVFLLKILNRRPFLIGTSFASGILVIVVVCIPSHLHWVRVVFACICNCFFFMSFIIVFLYGVELFPTSVRNSVFGVLSVMSRLGQIVAPLLNTLPHYASGSIFGVAALIGGALCFFLPETKNIELPSSLEDTKTLPYKKFRITNKIND